MISQLPPLTDLETKEILKALVKAHSKIAELKGLLSLSNGKEVYRNLILPLEVRDSIAMDGFVLEDEEIYKILLDIDLKVANYAFAGRYLECLNLAQKKRNYLTKASLRYLHECLTGNKTVITAEKEAMLDNIYDYASNDNFQKTDILVKIALISHQLFKIKAFEVGNRQLSRIATVLLLMREFKLQGVGLNLSNYLRENQSAYLKTEKNTDWESWILFFLKSVSESAQRTVRFIKNAGVVQQQLESKIKRAFPKFNEKELAKQICKYPVIIISALEEEMKITRLTALKYLEELTDKKILTKVKSGKFNYYQNPTLLSLLKQN